MVSDKEKNSIHITEKYITFHALPNEEINSWLKWNDSLNFDSIILRTEADVRITHFLNTNQDVYESNPDPFKGKYIINNSWLDVKTFFGFQCYYAQIPQSDRKIIFYVDFILNDKIVLQVELDTNIIIPNVVLKTTSKNEILITEYQHQYDLQFQLENAGKGNVRHVQGVVEIVKGSKDLEIQIIAKSSKFKLFESSVDQLITITGTGYAFIRIGYEYYDFNDNRYRTNTLDLILNKRIKEKSSIPIKGTIEENVPIVTQT